MNLTEHFTLEEMVRSDTAERLGIDQTPDGIIENNLMNLAQGLERIRTLLGFPLLVSSGYRSPPLERVICASDFERFCRVHSYPSDDASWQLYLKTKAHPQGFAADFTCPSFGPPTVIVSAIEASDIQFDQLIQEGSWVHFAIGSLSRRQVLTAAFSVSGTTYTLGN